MIISRAPVRITLGGGGTDLPSYYEKYEGFLIAGTINKYVFVGANRQFHDTIKLNYSKSEEVTDVKEILHNLFREALKFKKIGKGIELHSLADIPAGSGLGSSGAFLISLLNTLHVYKYGVPATKRQLAEEACKIELEILKEHEGKQDKYACAFGGITAYTFFKDGNVSVRPLANEDVLINELEAKMLIFYTGKNRESTASNVLKFQDEKCKEDDHNVVEKLHNIKKIGLKTMKALENNNFDDFGYFLNEHWEMKKQYSPHATSLFTDKCYKIALAKGALGGKVMGAGGGGFFLFYHPGTEKKKKEFIDALKHLGLHQLPFKFDKTGISTMFTEEAI